MTLLKIARMGHPVLARAALPVTDPTDPHIGRLVADMAETMEDAQGVGLAAPQVYRASRVIIFKAPPARAGDGGEAAGPHDVAPLTALINPSFEPLGEEMELGLEGCLSIPGLTGVVPRYRHIVYRGFAPDGTPIAREATGFHARVVQHEIDHLDGVLYLMRMDDLNMLAFNEEVPRMLQSQTGDAHTGDALTGDDAE